MPTRNHVHNRDGRASPASLPLAHPPVEGGEQMYRSSNHPMTREVAAGRAASWSDATLAHVICSIATSEFVGLGRLVLTRRTAVPQVTHWPVG